MTAEESIKHGGLLWLVKYKNTYSLVVRSFEFGCDDDSYDYDFGYRSIAVPEIEFLVNDDYRCYLYRYGNKYIDPNKDDNVDIDFIPVTRTQIILFYSSLV